MKKPLTGIILVLLLGTFSWGQGTKELFDVKKSREELEIMKGILNTTLRFAAENTQKQASSWRFFSSPNGFYLSGQGAVFVISASGARVLESPGSFNLGPEFAEEMAKLDEVRAELSETSSRMATWNSRGRDGSIVIAAPPSPPAPPAAPSPAAAPAPPVSPAQKSVAPKPEAEREKLRKAVEVELANVNKRREEAAANREKFIQNLVEVKTHLVETLGNYGDSMTTVKPEEYINLVLLSDGRSDVISARKSWITDYKAGRVNLEGFKQKVIQYNQ
jgi:hypothetical protein